MNKELMLERLEESIRKAQGARFERFRKAPFRILKSAFLWRLSSRRQSPINRDVKTFWDARLTVIPPEPVSLSLERYGFFEESVTRGLLQLLKPGMTLIDVGAHLGYFSALGAELVGPRGQVHSFEPTPNTFSLLQKNVRSLTQVVPNNIALNECQAKLVLSDFGTRYSSFNTVSAARLDTNTLAMVPRSTFEVDAVALDDYVGKTNIAPHFIKIDAENAELSILKGSICTIGRYRPIVCAEPGDESELGLQKTRDVVAFMAERKYQVFAFDGPSLKPWSGNIDRFCLESLFFLPR